MIMHNSSSIGTTTFIPIHAQAGLSQKQTTGEWICVSHPSYAPYLSITALPTLSALPVDVLQQDFWVPGSTSRSESTKFQNKALFKEILTPDLETCELWITRATEDSL